MKQILRVSILSILLFTSCKSDDNIDNSNQEVNITLKFNQNWDGTTVTNTNFNTIQYTNANDQELSIERLRYLISRVMLTSTSNQEYIINAYNLVDVGAETGLTYISETAIPTGTYTMSFVFGFNDQDNTDGTYPDLNSATWNVPNTPMLGSVGGYHYMQLEGKFTDNSNNNIGYAYHTIRAANGTTTVQDTSIPVNFGTITITNNATIEIQMNIAEWFKSPNQWDLNTLNQMLMPNYNAQIMMNQNGQNVFSLGEITQ